MTPEQQEEFGEVKASLEHIKTDLAEIKSDNKTFLQTFSDVANAQVANTIVLQQQQREIDSLKNKTERLEKYLYRGLGIISTLTTIAFILIEAFPYLIK